MISLAVKHQDSAGGFATADLERWASWKSQINCGRIGLSDQMLVIGYEQGNWRLLLLLIQQESVSLDTYETRQPGTASTGRSRNWHKLNAILSKTLKYLLENTNHTIYNLSLGFHIVTFFPDDLWKPEK
jgi:hypothetical protein